MQVDKRRCLCLFYREICGTYYWSRDLSICIGQPNLLMSILSLTHENIALMLDISAPYSIVHTHCWTFIL